MADLVDLDAFRNTVTAHREAPSVDLDASDGAGEPSALLRAEAQRRTSNRVSEPVTREELNDKLAVAEARTETRFVQLDARLDKLTSALTDKGGLLDQMSDLRAQMRSEASTTRWTVAAVFVASVLAGAGLVLTTQANLLSAFQAALAVHH